MIQARREAGQQQKERHQSVVGSSMEQGKEGGAGDGRQSLQCDHVGGDRAVSVQRTCEDFEGNTDVVERAKLRDWTMQLHPAQQDERPGPTELLWAALEAEQRRHLNADWHTKARFGMRGDGGRQTASRGGAPSGVMPGETGADVVFRRPFRKGLWSFLSEARLR